MKAHIASLVNALALISIGLWGYLVGEVGIAIAVGFGIILLLCYKGVKNENKVIAILHFF